MLEHEAASGTQPEETELRLDFDAWADLSARLIQLDGDARLDILDEAEVGVNEWGRCEEHYALAIADDIAHGRMERAERYASKCVAEMARRAEPRPPPSRAAELDPTPPDEVDVAPPAPPAPAEQAPTHLHEEPAHGPPPPRAAPPQNLATTVTGVTVPAALRSGALPFKKSDTPSMLATPAEPRPQPPADAGGGKRGLGGTQTMDGAALLKAALPFAGAPARKPSPPAFPQMPLRSYASLHAELAVFPHRAADVRKKYAVADETMQAALDRDWQARFDAYPETKAEWQRLVAGYQTWLAGQAR